MNTTTLWKQFQGLDPAFSAIQNCLMEDWFLLPYELRLQRAHADALEAAGVLTKEEVGALAGALDEIDRQFAGSPAPESGCEDLHTWVEAELTERVGAPGRKIHTARSRNDQVATLIKLYLIDAGTRLEDGVRQLVRSFCEGALKWKDLQFPLQTHAQFAAPGSVGFWALRYASAFDRGKTHLKFLLGEWTRFCPLGSGAVAGSSIPIDRSRQADGLGFESPSLNAMDSITARDECLEILSAGAHLALHLQSFACDGIGFAQTPFQWVRYPAAFATGSSMMPNKSNPDALELLRGECNAIHAAHGQAILILKGLPSGYNRDLQCIKPVVRDAVEKLIALVEMAHSFVNSLDFDPSRLESSLEQGNIYATLRMEQAVLSGCSLRDAHHAEAQSGGPGSGADSARPGLDAYRTTGSPNPEEVRRVAELILADHLG